MTPLRFALCLTYLFLGGLAQKTDWNSSIHVRQTSGFYSANVGDNVTLRCFYDKKYKVYWYKQTLAQKPRTISSFHQHDKWGAFHNEFKNNSRFTLDAGEGKNHLMISDLVTSDTATYYCVGDNRFDLEFAGGTVVNVKGSGLNIPALVHQSASETIQPGGSETLSCTVHTGTCDGEHRVYWFRHSEESHPGLIYTHGGRKDQCERKPEAQTHTCVYNLPMESLDVSHAGTYYCAVASCGYIVFGNGTKLEYEHEVDSLVYLLSGALAFTSILSVLLAYKAYAMYKTNSCKCTESQARPSVPHAGGDQDADNLHYAAVRMNKANRSTRQRDPTPSECVYSGVKQ